MALRGLHTFVCRLRKGERAQFSVENVQLGRYTSPTAVRCFRPDGAEIAFDDIPLRGSREIVIEADADGAWVLAVTSHNNAYRVRPDSEATVLYSPGMIAACARRSEVHRYFFYVPRAARTFQLQMRGYGDEKATFRLFGPSGKEILARKDLGESVTCEIDAGGLSQRVCWLEIADVVEDHSFGLVGIPNIFATRPEHLLAPQR